MENSFIPIQIGLPDSKLESAIVADYTNICDQATAMLYSFESFFGSQKNPTLFLEFVNSKSPKNWLYQQFIKMNQIKVPGLSIEKIVDLELIEVPLDDFSALLVQQKELENMISKTKESRFYYPLAKLFRQVDEDIRDFAISHQNPGIIQTPEFDAALYNHVRKFTKNDEENQALAAVHKIIEGFNDLVMMGIIRNSNSYYRLDITDLLQSICFTRNTEKPFSMASKIVFMKPLSLKFKHVRFSNIKSFGNQSDILNHNLMEEVLNDADERIWESE